ncbi:hypothetical protein NW760_001093 [Fusarium oxysporum]|nr:hypothetical protein NW760_001093 [Fusarium oxysporum]
MMAVVMNPCVVSGCSDSSTKVTTVSYDYTNESLKYKNAVFSQLIMSYSFFNILGKNQTARCHTGDPLPIAGRSPLLVPLRDPRLVLLRDPLLVLQGEPSQGPSSRPPQGLPSYPSGGPPTHSHRPSSRTSQGPSTLPSQTSTSGYFQTVASRPHEPPSPLQGFNSQGSPSLLEESPSRPRHESAPCPTEIPSHLDETPADIPPDVVNGWACVVTQDWDSRDHTLPQGLVPGLKVIKGDEVWVFRTNQRYGLVHRPHGATYLRGWVTVDVLQKGVQRVDPLPIELPQVSNIGQSQAETSQNASRPQDLLHATLRDL